MGLEVRGMKSVKSFGKLENRKLGNFLIIVCTILSLCILSLVKAHYCPSPSVRPQAALKLQMSTKAEVKMVTEESGDDSSIQEDEDEDEDDGPKVTTIENPKPICYESSPRSDTCEAEGEIRVQGSSKTVFLNSLPASQEVKIKPSTRKHDPGALAHVQEWSLKPLLPNNDIHSLPQCTNNYTEPALIFSIGGFTGNLFHDYTDVLIPLFITSRHFQRQVHFLVSDTKPWWLGRFKRVLSQLTNHEIIDTDSQSEANTIRCFPKVVIGPTFHKELGIIDKPTSNTSSMLEFKALLRNAFGLQRAKASNQRPRLLIISRKRSRAFLNEQRIVSMATSLGFDVRVGEPNINTDVAKFARLVNSADVMIGVHGAGLTNMVYLPMGAVMIQVVPLGGLGWLAKNTFGEPSLGMGVKYLEYVIKEEESSLIEEYARDDEVIRDPHAVHKRGWGALREVYLDKQNVKPHLGRLRNKLLEAIKLLPKD